MSKIVIINVYDDIRATGYTFNQYFTDIKQGTSTSLAKDLAETAVASMASYWAQQNNGNYIGFDSDSEEYIVQTQSGDVAMAYSLQVLESSHEENQADNIIPYVD